MENGLPELRLIHLYFIHFQNDFISLPDQTDSLPFVVRQAVRVEAPLFVTAFNTEIKLKKK